MLDVIVDGLGHKRVATLSVKDCDDFLKLVALGQKRAGGVTQKPVVRQHVSRIRSMLERVLNNEVRLGFQARNVAELAEMPTTPARSREHRILTPAELVELLAASTGAVSVFIDLCGRNGLRPQEARVICWVNLDRRAATLDAGPQMNRSGRIVGPKTKRAPRTIAIGKGTLDLLAKRIG